MIPRAAADADRPDEEAGLVAWRAVLIAYAAAIAGYAAAAPVVDDGDLARQRYAQLLAERDWALVSLAQRGGTDLDLPALFDIPADAADDPRSFLAAVEARLVPVLADAVTYATTRQRSGVLDRIRSATVWSLRWGGGVGAWGPQEVVR